MPTTRIRLFAADLHYPADLVLHTAIAGAIEHLACLYLVIDQGGRFLGEGEVRANITYLTHLPAEHVAPAIRELCRRLPWSMPPADLLAAVPDLAGEAPNIARAAVTNTLVDGLARAAGVPVARFLGGAWQAATPTNQCLFWGPDDRFDRLAKRYVEEGFNDLKVRIGVGDFEIDLARLQRLRSRFGTAIQIAADANGAWSGEQARARLAQLARFGLVYVEQPTHPGDWDGFRAALRDAPMPLMLDESLVSPDDLQRLIDCGPGTLAHLKLVKLGGPMAVLRAARMLAEAGVGVMVGQMNEGALATALAAHCAMALQPLHAELYGCYGLLDDVTTGLSYAGGTVRLRDAPGLGVTFDRARCTLVWEETFT